MKTVLVVDDQANVRRLIRDYLTQEGFRVVEAENGRLGPLVALRRRDGAPSVTASVLRAADVGAGSRGSRCQPVG